MSHSDDNGLVLPPMSAPIHIVFIPIWNTDEEKQQVSDYIKLFTNKLDERRL